MNIFLWILQVGLAVLCLAGGAYKASMAGELASQFPTLPPGGWGALGVIEILVGLLLVVPASLTRMPILTAAAAAVLALEALALTGVYAQYSLEVAVTNPLVWTVGMGLAATFVAYGRYALGTPEHQLIGEHTR